MFRNILMETNEDPNDFNKEGKIPALEDAFKDNPVALKVAYMIATSHEYKKPNVEAAIVLAKNYDWEESSAKVEDIQGIDKPVNNEKVFEIATTLKKDGHNKFPLIVVDKLHGIFPQSKGKLILLDGHHRKHGMEFAGITVTPVYKGTYNGDAEKDTKELVSVVEAYVKTGSTEGFANLLKEEVTDEQVNKQFAEMVFRMTRYANSKYGDEHELGFEYDSVRAILDEVNEGITEYFVFVSKRYPTPDKNKPADYSQDMKRILDDFVSHFGFNKITEKVKVGMFSSVTRDRYYHRDNPFELSLDKNKTNFTLSLILRKRIATESSIINEDAKTKLVKVELTPEERKAVKEKYGNVQCSFFKNETNGKYFCMTHRVRSKFYDSPTDIPVDEVRFVSSTA